ncbi:MAG: hypothetical protein GY846_14365 [Deltaproteobacteria bacterium]|nr:hypothetical protein [Deltaproteobacteria bacterium]
MPHDLAQKFARCGYCEHFCPVQNRAAIVVTPMDALGMKKGRYETEARIKGIDF